MASYSNCSRVAVRRCCKPLPVLLYAGPVSSPQAGGDDGHPSVVVLPIAEALEPASLSYYVDESYPTKTFAFPVIL